MPETNYDLVIIGGGPGGYVAAIRAAQLGLKTVLVEREQLGGVCLNWGCIPTKALLRSAEVYHLMKRAEDFGLSADGVHFDLGKVVQRSRAVSQKLAQGVAYLMKKNKVKVISGTAQLQGRKGKNHIVAVSMKDQTLELQAPSVVLATGARPRILPGLEPDGERILTYREAMVPKELPASLLIVGSGAIGIEFAHFYQTFGTSVTVVELQKQILPLEDTEIAALARKEFEKQGVVFHTGTTVERLEVGKAGVTAHLKGAASGPSSTSSLTVDRVIVAAGIMANIEEVGLGKTQVKLEKGHIVVNEHCQTHEPGLYAIGDVAGPPWLAHKASHEGILCAQAIAGKTSAHHRRPVIPACTYSRPQIASMGLTEAQAQATGRPLRVGRFPFSGNGKAIALGEEEGLVKTIFDQETGELLGAHMIGAEVTEMIQGLCVAQNLEATEEDLMHTIFPHPTLSEMMYESVLDAWERVIHR